MRRWLGILALGTAALGTGCGGAGATAPAPLDGPLVSRPGLPAGPSFSDVYDRVLSRRGCVNSYCHPVEGMDAAYDHFLADRAVFIPCRGRRLVVRGDPEGSLLYLKVSMDPPLCGSRMPALGATLAGEEIDLIRAWIEGG